MLGMRTVEELFERIRAILASRPASVNVRYDPARGYPTSVNVDEVGGVADDEYAVIVTAFAPAP